MQKSRLSIKAGTERNVKYWTKHLTDCEINDRAELMEVRGFCYDNLARMLEEIQILTTCGTSADNGMYIAKFSPPPHWKLTPQQWDRAFEIFEQQRGIPKGQRRIVYEHETAGRIHRYVVWERLILETMKLFPAAHDHVVCSVAARKISQELFHKW